MDETDEMDEMDEMHDGNYHFLWRVQALYNIPVSKRFSIVPHVAVDFQSSRQVWVYGVSLGICF